MRRLLALFAIVAFLAQPGPAHAQVQRELLNPDVLEELYAIVVRAVGRDVPEIAEPAAANAPELAARLRELGIGETIQPVRLSESLRPSWRTSSMSEALAGKAACTRTAVRAFACSEIERALLKGALSKTPSHLDELSQALGTKYASFGTHVVVPKSFRNVDLAPIDLQPAMIHFELPVAPGVISSAGDGSQRAYASLAKLPFSSRDVRFISFVDDSATQNALAPAGKRATVICATAEVDALREFRSALVANRGRQVFVVFHNEGGDLTVRDAGGVRYRVTQQQMFAMAKADGVTIFPVTCQGARRLGSGFYEDVDAPLMVDTILGAARGSRTQQDFVRRLGGELASRRSDVLIDPSQFAHEGVVTLRCRRRTTLGMMVGSGSSIGLGGATIAMRR